MLKSFVGKFNNTNDALNWLKCQSPDDEIVFTSAATVIESSSITPVKWYQRFSGQRTTLILTNNQVAFKKCLISPIIAFDILMIIIFLIMFIISKEWIVLLWVLLFFVDALPYPSYQRQVQYKDIRKIMLDVRNSVRTELVIDAKGMVIHAFFAEILPKKVLNVITSRTEIVVSS